MWATAMAVKIRPKPPHAATIPGPTWLDQPIMTGENEYSAKRDIAANIPIESPRDIPERCAQQEARQQERQSDDKAVVTQIDDFVFRATDSGGKSGQQRNQRRALRRSGTGEMFEVQKPGLDVAALHGRERNASHEPKALRNEDRQKQERDNLRNTNARAESGEGHLLLL